MTSRKIIVPGGGTILPRVDPMHRIGSLIHIEPAHATQPWVPGVPAGSIKNVAGAIAEQLVGGPATDFTIFDTLTGHGGIVERTSKGGLHFIVSRVADETGKVWTSNSTLAIRQWLSASENRTHTTFMGAAIRVTRAGSGTADQIIRLAENASATRAAISVGSSVAYGDASPTLYRIDYGSMASPGIGTPWVAVNNATSFVSDPLIIAGPLSSSHLHTSPSWILYELYVEDCTASGRTWQQARDEFTARTTEKFATAWANDTWTPPSTAMPD